MTGSAPTLAWLAGGRIYTDSSDEPFDSPFAQQVHDRGLEIQQRNAWKHEGSGARFATGGMSVMATQQAVTPMPTIAHVCRGNEPGEVWYCLSSHEITGVFRCDLAAGEEQRLYHSNQTRLEEIAPRPLERSMACSLRSDSGTVDLALLELDRGGLSTLTGGDSVDQAPSWREGHPELLLFMSAGVGRNEQGLPVALGPYSIERMDTRRGDLETLVEDDDHDLLTPRMDRDGTLYFIRRPYHRESGPSAWRILQAILLFPIHFFWMLFHIVNNFTASFSRKPLLKAGGPGQQVDDKLLLWGQVVDITERARGLRNKPGTDSDAPIGPDTWELVRRTEDGKEKGLAKGVLSFDLRPDGSVVYANGAAVFELDDKDRPKRLAKGAQIRQVVALG